MYVSMYKCMYAILCMNYVLYIVSIHLHSIFCSAQQSEVRPVRDTQREETNVHVSMYVRMYA